MIELYHVWKQYQKPLWALSDVNLSVTRGEFCFITGPSGSGKSTLLKAIYREVIPTEGQIIISGINIQRIPDHKICAIRRQMGIVFQDFRLLFHKRVFDNVSIALRVLGAPPRDMKRKTFIALRMVNLQQRLWDYPSQLSYGEQQRVAIARAIVNNPRILLADEPTGNLDPDLAHEIFGLFRVINKQGTTVIICTHDKELIRRFGGRVLYLHEGKLHEKDVG
ncbi:MAG: cell division ATP-binding protein FtsE [Candidatus Aminicenantes bacterium]|jgi:cell division transport system ATP-binding protein|nr:cell division ATP-binding protein FtsE [Candidatus Aminicenantes bacterium]